MRVRGDGRCEQMRGDGLGVKRKEKVRKEKSSQHGTMCLLSKKTTKGSRTPIT